MPFSLNPNVLLKSLADEFLKAPADKLVANLTENQVPNVAYLEQNFANFEGTAGKFVSNFLMEKIKAPNAIVQGLENLALPNLESLLEAELDKAGTDIPSLYATGLAFLTKEASYL